MTKRLLVVLAGLLSAACQHSDVKVLIGAATVVSPGVTPIEDSVIVIAEGRIRAVGARKDIPIPQDSERVDLTGKRVAPVDGARIAVNESADLVVTGGSEARRMLHGQWQ